jgi:hypothetical protein
MSSFNLHATVLDACRDFVRSFFPGTISAPAHTVKWSRTGRDTHQNEENIERETMTIPQSVGVGVCDTPRCGPGVFDRIMLK